MDTKRNGLTRSAPIGLQGPGRRLQRFVCKACGKSFTFARRASAPRARFAEDARREAVRIYVESKASYRELARQLSRRMGQPVSKTSLNRWVDEAGALALTPLELSAKLGGRWSGILGIDGKAVFVRRQQRCVLFGVDLGTHDIVHAAVVDAETEAAFSQFLTDLVRMGRYPLKALVMDASPGFVAGWANYFGRLPLQLCRIHFDRHLDWEIPKRRHGVDADARAELKSRVRGVLYADTPDEAAGLMHALSDDVRRYRTLATYDPISALRRRFGLYMTHHDIAGLPADNNITENVVKQLGKKLALMEGFATDASAQRFVRLLVAAYRHKRFTDACPERCRRSPLELAGISTDGDWIRAVIDRPPQQH